MPILGYDSTPKDPRLVYFSEQDVNNIYSEQLNEENLQSSDFIWKHFLVIGDTSSRNQVMHVVDWKDVIQDLQNQLPYSFDIRNVQQGVIKKNTNSKQIGENEHCILEFKS